MEALIKKQYLLGARIRNSVANTLRRGRDNMDSNTITARVALIERYWTEFLNGHMSLVAMEGYDGSNYNTSGYFDEVENEYIEALGMYEGYSVSVNVSKRPAALPKIVLPNFSGNRLEWESFRDMFESMIVKDRDLSNVAKMQYLSSCVTGEPASLLANIPVTDRAFVSAWEALINRYDDEKAILYAHMQSLYELQGMKGETAVELIRVYDRVSETRRAIENLKRPAGDDWLIFFLVRTFDGNTRKAWEMSNSLLPSWNDVATFVDNRIRALEALPTAKPVPERVSAPAPRSKGTERKRIQAYVTKTQNKMRSCFVCKEQHFLAYCPEVKTKSVAERIELVKQLKLCTNCLGRHTATECYSEKRCLKCHQKHHTFLCNDLPKQPAVQVNMCKSVKAQALLATAMLRIVHGSRNVLVRALIDPGSEANFISEFVVQQLGLYRRDANVRLEGIGGCQPKSPRYTVNFEIRDRKNQGPILNIDAYVLQNVLGQRITERVERVNWEHLINLDVADPDFGVGTRPDAVLGVEVYAEILQPGLIKGPVGTPIAQETLLGWLIMGTSAVEAESSQRVSANVVCQPTMSISEQLRQFWEIEEVNAEPILTSDDELCERLYASTHERNDSGQYIVRLPIRQNVSLGDSRIRALRCLTAGEKRRAVDNVPNEAYCKFMNEYERLGHMVPATERNPNANFLPHHAVWKNGKIRVVFNAASRTSNGTTLNDTLYTGPKLHAEVSLILLNWRRYRFVFTADVVKMFRAILVHKDDQNMQHILWRESPDQDIKEYRLLTVTYGTACAPWLAIRTLRQLAADEAENFPAGAHILLHETYVDDCFSGGPTLSDAMRRKNELILILRAGGFELDKWATNEPCLMANERASANQEKDLATDNVVKTLGVFWCSNRDVFGYRVNFENMQSITRRTVLSHIARVFDPCGWISPVVIVAKILLQRLWTEHDGWDAPLNSILTAEWEDYVRKLSEAEKIEVPRWLCTTLLNEEVQVHGFCDSSERAYAACVYLRVKNVNDTRTMLVTAKTKVAPVKTVSLPRLELCGAVLLAKLMKKVVKGLVLENVTMCSWTDASIVLAWLRGHPSRWKSFIANRVSDIHGHLPNTIWRHGKSNDNPADLATRGTTAAALKDSELWWYGPCWLKEDDSFWPVSKHVETALEERVVKGVAVICETVQPWDLLERWSSYRELQRVTAWLQRFCYNATNDDKRTGNLTTKELSHADEFWIRHVQSVHFGPERNALRTGGGTVSRRSRLFRLNPFLDDAGIMRLGGRLANSTLPYAEIYPAILPNDSKLTNLLILRAHQMCLHGGTQLTLSVLHRTFWITNGKQIVSRVVRNCVNCFRYRAQPLSQLMGPLPQTRCRVNAPFSHTGVDYAGPIQLRTTKGRGHKSYKDYIVLFICLTVRAIHLEVVSDLTTEAFLATFRRFTSRRGLITTLYTDNATYFQGAKDHLTAQGVKWIFIPPRAPH